MDKDAPPPNPSRLANGQGFRPPPPARHPSHFCWGETMAGSARLQSLQGAPLRGRQARVA